MGFWSFLPFVADDPAPAPAAPARRPNGTPVPPVMRSAPPKPTPAFAVSSNRGPRLSLTEPLAQQNVLRGMAPEEMPQDYQPSPALRRTLEANGWIVPQETKPAKVIKNLDDKSLDIKKSRKLLSHDYKMDEKDWSEAHDILSNTQGYRYTGDDMFSGSTAPVVKGEAPVAAPMTQAAYDKLTDAQRRAVDFNTLLVEAREKDLRDGVQYTGGKREEYDKRVEAMFGTGGGSNQVALNTMKLLEGIDFKAVGQDLDEFLSLERAVTADQLPSYKDPAIPRMRAQREGSNYDSLREFSTVRSAENQDMVTAEAVRNIGVYIDEMLKKNRGFTLNDFARTEFGGQKAPFGWRPANTWTDAQDQAKEQFFQDAYKYAVARSTTNWNELFAKAQQNDMDDKDLDELFTYIKTRSQIDQRDGQIGKGSTRSADELLKFMEEG